jgi:hypothetical protein
MCAIKRKMFIKILIDCMHIHSISERKKKEIEKEQGHIGQSFNTLWIEQEVYHNILEMDGRLL